MYELRTFGGLSLEANGAPCTGAAAQRKTLALLALLARHPRGLSRDKVIAYLWPETDAAHGRSLLRQGCYALRRDLHVDRLFLGSNELRLNPAFITSDVQTFEDATHGRDLARAAALYAGTFLDGFYLRQATEFEDWVEVERGHLAKEACDVFEKLATSCAAAGDHQEAQRWWRRLAALEPLSSRAAIGLMTALAERGEIPEALGHGKAYEALVRDELGAPPEPDVTDLLTRLQREPAAAEGVSADDLRLAMGSGGRRTVGYEKQRAALRESFRTAVAGRGLMVCVAGEPGSGKTTLIEDLLGELVASGRIAHVTRGRCSERLAGSGAYLPLLDVLESLLRADARGAIAHLMKQHAPNWYAQVAPTLQRATQEKPPQVQAASQERLKRELNTFFREVCRLRPLVVFLDDVHWVDASTVDILSYVANQMNTAQMLIIVTYRPSELQLAKHPFGGLKLHLQGEGVCQELMLELLSPEDIAKFLELEYPSHHFPPTFARFVHAKTEGSPLFMVDLLRYLRGKHVIVADDGGWKLAGSLPDLQRELPESARSMIERTIEQLSEPDRTLLMAAAVQGSQFDSAVVTEALDGEVAQVEERLIVLDRDYGLVRPLSEVTLPDGTATVRYRFVHALYQNALYARLSPTRRATISRHAAAAQIAHYGARSVDLSAELAILLETARDFPRSVEYFTIAAQRAAGMFGYQEAAALARRGLALVERLPDAANRARRELPLQMMLGFALNATDTSGNVGTGHCMMRARDLCRELGDTPTLFPAMLGLWGYYLVTSDQSSARETAERMLGMAKEVQDPVWLLGAHTVLGASLTHLAEHAAGLEHLQRSMELYDLRRRQEYLSLYGQDMGVYCGCEIARTLWLLGYPERASKRIAQSLAVAEDGGDPQAKAFALIFAAILHQFRGEAEKSQERADELIALCDEHGIAGHREWGECVRGWALVKQGFTQIGLDLMRERIDTLRAKHILAGVDYFLAVLTQSLVEVSDRTLGLACVTEGLAIARSSNQPVLLAELLRLKGELEAMNDSQSLAAEAYFHEALAIARRQEAKSLELRAATSLARLWQRDGKHSDARNLLASVYGWFSEGFDTRDLQDAKSVLEQLK